MTASRRRAEYVRPDAGLTFGLFPLPAPRPAPAPPPAAKLVADEMPLALRWRRDFAAPVEHLHADLCPACEATGRLLEERTDGRLVP